MKKFIAYIVFIVLWVLLFSGINPNGFLSVIATLILLIGLVSIYKYKKDEIQE